MTTPFEDFKIHVGETDDVHDAILAQNLATATAWVEDIIDRAVTDADPATIHGAIRMLGAHLFENREATAVGVTASEIPFGVMTLLDAHRAWY